MKKFTALLLVAVMALSLAACGQTTEEKAVDTTVGTGKVEKVEGETLADVSALEPAANVNPSLINIGQTMSEEHTGDAWYTDAVRGNDYFYLEAADNSSIGLAYKKMENGECVKTVICAMTDDNHLVDEEAAEGESSIDIVFYDEFTAYDYKTEKWYVRGNPDAIEQLFIGYQLVEQSNPSNTLILRADGTGTEVYVDEDDQSVEAELTWSLTSASTLKYNDGEFDYQLTIVTDENDCFVSLSEENFRIFVLADQAGESTEETAETAETETETAAETTETTEAAAETETAAQG